MFEYRSQLNVFPTGPIRGENKSCSSPRYVLQGDVNVPQIDVKTDKCKIVCFLFLLDTNKGETYVTVFVSRSGDVLVQYWSRSMLAFFPF